jgi:hypothetical protein
LMLVLVLAQTAMPTAVYAKGGVGHSGHSPTHGTYFGGIAYPPGWYARPWGWGQPMVPQPGWGGGFVPGGGAVVYGPYYDPYHYPYYFYYRMPR